MITIKNSALTWSIRWDRHLRTSEKREGERLRVGSVELIRVEREAGVIEARRKWRTLSSAPGYGNNGRRGHPAVDYSGLPPSDTPSDRRHNLPLSAPLWNVAAGSVAQRADEDGRKAIAIIIRNHVLIRLLTSLLRMEFSEATGPQPNSSEAERKAFVWPLDPGARTGQPPIRRLRPQAAPRHCHAWRENRDRFSHAPLSPILRDPSAGWTCPRCAA